MDHNPSFNLFKPKMAGGVNLTYPVVLQKMYLLREGETLFFVIFNIIISHIFQENFIETPQVVQTL